MAIKGKKRAVENSAIPRKIQDDQQPTKKKVKVEKTEKPVTQSNAIVVPKQVKTKKIEKKLKNNEILSKVNGVAPTKIEKIEKINKNTTSEQSVENINEGAKLAAIIKQKAKKKESKVDEPKSITASVEELEDRIQKILDRENISRTARRRLATFRKQLQIKQGTYKPTVKPISTVSKTTKRKMRRLKKILSLSESKDEPIEEVESKAKNAANAVKGAKNKLKNTNTKITAEKQKNGNEKVKSVANKLKNKKGNVKVVPEDENEEDEEQDESMDVTINSTDTPKKNDDSDNVEDDDEDEDEEEEDDEDEEEEEEEEGEDDEEEEDDDDDDEEDDDDDDDEDEDEDDGEKVETEIISKSQIKTKKSNAISENDTQIKKNKPENTEVSQKKARYVLFIGNLPYSATVDEIKQHFMTKVNEILCVRIPLSPENKPRGFAYIEFSNNIDYEKALSLHQSNFGGRRINVQYSQSGSKDVGKRPNVIAKNQKLHALRKQGKLAGSVKDSQKRNARRNKGKNQAA